MTTTRIAALLFAGAALTACSAQTTPLPAPSTTPAASVPACAQEDSPGPCFWDAKTQGNGKGRSFFVDAAGNVYYTTPPAASKDRGYVMTHSGKVVRMDAKGCFFLEYDDAYGVPKSDYDPGDGEFFCAR